ncbi:MULTISPECIES: iron-siderophore ABC transporter substrate-binding protein [Rhodococcus]|uniref:iron-siderophore ABC transporter substrate-binding protein n=1 Tax=Rhodococcus TaxID=1827 RepID=UPI0024770A71|nr:MULTISPECIES: iron-siderophore ABC transporter substrate-binding protein [Rhodococcus]MDH6291195.1 iron complex transport system substrate-binding protein [Rhodococcus opacus]MDI9951280.1 iron-siderophore ABC transporter substrate-binding protein [Rhodococcus sp. IEGM 1305]
MFAPTARRQIAVALAVASSSLFLAACSSGDNGGTTEASGEGFPVTIENTFGSTTLDGAPERIVTLGWNAQDVVYALGETPVGMPKYTYGAEANGVMPWLQDRFDPSQTTLLDTATSTPIEGVASLAPDVVLAPYEGFDQATYEKLSGIAPTVAYPDKAWQTTWQDQTTLVGQALGKSAEAEQLVAGLDDTLAQTAAAHPEFAGKTISVINFDTDAATVNVYMPSDPRVQVLTQLGFTVSPGVQKLAAANDPDKFFADISVENISDVDADVVVAFVPENTTVAANPAYANLGAIGRGTAVALSDTKIISGLSQTSVLATPWVLDKLTPQLSEAATKAGA